MFTSEPLQIHERIHEFEEETALSGRKWQREIYFAAGMATR